MDFISALIGLIPVLAGAIAAIRPRKRRLKDINELQQLVNSTRKKALKRQLQDRIDEVLREEVLANYAVTTWTETFRQITRGLTVGIAAGASLTVAGILFLPSEMSPNARDLAIGFAVAGLLTGLAWMHFSCVTQRREKNALTKLNEQIEEEGEEDDPENPV